MTTIERHGPHATLINVFTVEPANAAELADVLNDATERVMQHVPGFVSANIHVSTDRCRVVNYAQWESATRTHGRGRCPRDRLRSAPLHRGVRPSR